MQGKQTNRKKWTWIFEKMKLLQLFICRWPIYKYLFYFLKKDNISSLMTPLCNYTISHLINKGWCIFIFKLMVQSDVIILQTLFIINNHSERLFQMFEKSTLKIIVWTQLSRNNRIAWNPAVISMFLNFSCVFSYKYFGCVGNILFRQILLI